MVVKGLMFMRAILALALILAVVPAGVCAAPGGPPVAMLTPAGSVLMSDGTVIPLFPKSGRWAQVGEKSTDRYDTQHFMYLVPSEPPAIELIVAADRSNEAPDGVFEMGLVKGYVSSFATKSGLQFSDPMFGDRNIGGATVKHALAKLWDDRRTLWVHAYIYLRNPSLTFIAIRPSDGAQESIEKYLATVEMK